MLRVLVTLLVFLLGQTQLATAATTARIAVLDFTNASTDPDLAPLGKGLQSMLTTDLSQVEALTLVERERLRDITAELDLGTSDLVDPKTAANIGRLAGASHLLVGSFTVVGSSMRLDARLVEVEGGSIVLAEQIEGETEAFFELEQALVQSLVKALEVDLAPKERAGIRRIHTADYEAFRAFSRGIDRFDAEAYDDAVAALQDAAGRDEDFKLARVTLREYEQIIGRLRARSASLETSRAALERLKKARQADDQAEVLARLWAIAEDDPSAKSDAAGVLADRRRPASLYLLAVAYGNVGQSRGELLRLRQVEDAFAMDRSADALHRAFFEEAVPRWPELPLVVSDRFWWGLPELRTKDGEPAEDPFDVRFAELATHLFEKGADYPDNRRKYLLDDLRYPSKMARRLHLDRAEEIEFFDLLYGNAQILDPPDYWTENFEEVLAKKYRAVLRLDDSTRMYTKLAAALDHPRAIEGIAKKIEVNRDYQRLLDQAKNKVLMREWLLLGQASNMPVLRVAREELAGATPTAKGLEYLSRSRKLSSNDDYILLGDHPAWTLQASGDLWTGPRSDSLRTSSLRYYRDEAAELETFVLLDGVPTKDVTAKFHVDHQPATDWSPPKDLAPAGATPHVRFLFSVVDVSVEKSKDPETDKYRVDRPTQLWAVRFADGKAHLEHGVESKRGFAGYKKFAWTEVASSPVGFDGDVAISVSGTQVTIRGPDRVARLRLPDAPAAGFYGFLFGGAGYIEIGRVRFKRDVSKPR